MNRIKFAVASFALATLVTLSACTNPVTENSSGVVITMKDKDGDELPYTADELFGEYQNNEFGVSKFIEAVTELVIRNQINQDNPASKALKAGILNKADISVSGVKQTARTNASTNGTNYNDELETLFESYGVEDLEELKDYFAYLTMKQEVEDRFFDKYKDSFLSGDNGYLTERLPYHVKHILVKVSAAGGDLYNGRISEAEAKKLFAVANRLATQKNDETFGEVARDSSDDDSKDQWGDLGIMSKATSFVNEFKLGIYAYDSVFNQDEEVASKAELLNVPETAVEYFDELGLGRIPFHAFESLNEFAGVTKDREGNPVNNNDSLYFPRNIIFNKYFNRHNIAVVTPEKLEGGNYDYKGFKQVDELADELEGQKVLTDENGKVILVVRAGTGSGESGYQGIHFIVVERSALVDIQDGVSLEDYYTTEIPGTPDYPTEDNEDLTTFVNFFSYDDNAPYKQRADTVKNEIRNFDRFFNFRMLEKLIADQEVTFVDGILEETVLRYMRVTRRSAAFDQELQELDTWNSYIEFLEYQKFQRQRLIDLKCAYGYLTNQDQIYSQPVVDQSANDERGSCYVQK
jgi:hypothetical protein